MFITEAKLVLSSKCIFELLNAANLGLGSEANAVLYL